MNNIFRTTLVLAAVAASQVQAQPTDASADALAFLRSGHMTVLQEAFAREARVGPCKVRFALTLGDPDTVSDYFEGHDRLAEEFASTTHLDYTRDGTGKYRIQLLGDGALLREVVCDGEAIFDGHDLIFDTEYHFSEFERPAAHAGAIVETSTIIALIETHLFPLSMGDRVGPIRYRGWSLNRDETEVDGESEIRTIELAIPRSPFSQVISIDLTHGHVPRAMSFHNNVVESVDAETVMEDDEYLRPTEFQDGEWFPAQCRRYYCPAEKLHDQMVWTTEIQDEGTDFRYLPPKDEFELLNPKGFTRSHVTFWQRFWRGVLEVFEDWGLE